LEVGSVTRPAQSEAVLLQNLLPCRLRSLSCRAGYRITAAGRTPEQAGRRFLLPGYKKTAAGQLKVRQDGIPGRQEGKKMSRGKHRGYRLPTYAMALLS